MLRQIIRIDEEKCDGCGLCIPNCHEGALQVIDGKARLVSDLFCDGLGACIGHCPQGAITMEEREAEPYSERKVMEGIVGQGSNTVMAHLQHLRDHNETGYLNEALQFLEQHQIKLSAGEEEASHVAHHHAHVPHGHVHVSHHHGGGCPGSLAMDFREDRMAVTSSLSKANDINTPSALQQWPVQLHLLNPMAGYLQGSDLLLASDCSAFTAGNFHGRFLKGKSLAIACPKLDHGKESYVQKLAIMIRDAGLNTVTVLMMEVPCCGGLLQLVEMAMEQAGRKIPVMKIILGIRGEVLSEDWL
ncbi:MAG TPA: 4Fe-4S binding protein [Bacteroidales bacterium]|nr:4Fe-4S binding protein [Bacteroidales bacterium]HSA42791.1 4Fe-4S binding protein [Bacteroidales bacterium]